MYSKHALNAAVVCMSVCVSALCYNVVIIRIIRNLHRLNRRCWVMRVLA